MILDQDKIRKILDIVKKHHLVFLNKTVGKDALTDEELRWLQGQGLDISDVDRFVKDSYDVGSVRNVPQVGPPENIPLEQFRLEDKPFLTEEAKYAIDHVENAVVDATKRLSSSIQQKVNGVIRDSNIKFRNFLMDERAAPVIVRGIEKNKQINEIVRDLREVTGDFARDWHRVAVTEIGNAASHGAADAIRERNKKKKTDEIYVYKRVVGDEALCPHCSKFWLHGGKPKVYKLSDLVKNGSNVGQRAGSWQPTVDITHPHCRCILQELPKGWAFNKKGQATYEGPDYLEYREQKK